MTKQVPPQERGDIGQKLYEHATRQIESHISVTFTCKQRQSGTDTPFLRALHTLPHIQKHA